MRPKPDRPDGGKHNAFFYSLVSRDTDEVVYASKRQAFLVDQGYSFKVVTEAAQLEHDTTLPLSARHDQLCLLGEVLACDETDGADELAGASVDDGAGAGEGGGLLLAPPVVPAVRRQTGSLSGLSGGDGLLYQEYSRDDRSGIASGLESALGAASEGSSSLVNVE